MFEIHRDQQQQEKNSSAMVFQQFLRLHSSIQPWKCRRFDRFKESYTYLSETLGLNFLAYDYEGYGLSEGESSEKASFDDVESAFRWLTEDEDGPKIEPSKVILFGRSLGSGPTIHLASKHGSLAGLILQSPLRTAMKTQLYDWVASSILRPADIFDNETKILKVTNYPVLIIHGKNDRVVPFSHGEYLYEQVKKKNNCGVSHYWVDGCGHNDIEVRKGDEFLVELSTFIQDFIRTRNKKDIDMDPQSNNSGQALVEDDHESKESS